MRRAALCLSIVIGTVLLGPPAASGGGWWTSASFDDEYLVVGDTARGWIEPLRVGNASPLLKAGDTYYVYLIPDFDWEPVDRAMVRYPPGEWWEQPEEAILVGHTVLRDAMRVDVEFVVPDVAPGAYAVMVCDLGCVHPMGAAVPTGMTVVDSPQALALSRRLDRVTDRFHARLARTRRQLRASIFDARAASATENEHDFLRDRVSALEEAIERLPTDPAEPPPVWPLALGWGLAGMATGATLVLARRRRIEVLVPVPGDDLTFAPERSNSDRSRPQVGAPR